MSKILVVDDKEMMRDSVATILSRRGHTVWSAAHGDAALERMSKGMPDLVVTDLQMPRMNGLELLGEIKDLDDQVPVIVMTAFGTIETAVEAMKIGAFDYVTKPFSGDELVIAIDRAIEHGRLVKENQVLKVAATSPTGRAPSHPMVGQTPSMCSLKQHLDRIADSHGTVLVTGESGSGKEVAARAIHQASPRSGMPFLAINCAALSASLLESELFGHEKGAFTGADKLRKGRFELAEGGTLLLDEISEIGPDLQAKLLRVLQERCFERVGSSKSLSVDVRVIATTNRDLQKEVAEGRFREDLFFRLNVLPLAMPPLRDRMEDVPVLAQHFLDLVASREGRESKRFDDDAISSLCHYRWPGNVRELQNICERASVLSSSDVINAELIEPWLVASGADVIETPVNEPGGVSAMLEASRICDGTFTLEDIEREAILATLANNSGHRQRSAKALGIGVRTLGLKLKKWKQSSLIEETV
ncbi:MAG: hypothetical protein CMJ32_11660 [Phycisphaerae bacterium]|nr:hypothetical protein [Phycisphaerae bacterium]